MTRTAKKKITTLALIGGLLLTSYVALEYVFPLIWPFILAYGIALLVHPIVKFMIDKLHFHKNAATILTLCFTLIGIGVVLFFIVNGIIIQSLKLINNWPEYQEMLLSYTQNMCHMMEKFFKLNKGTIYDTVCDGATSAVAGWQKNMMSLFCVQNILHRNI